MRKTTEVIKLNKFMDGSYKKRNVRDYKAMSIIPVFNPLAMLDPFILTVGGIVLAIVFAERFLERAGLSDIAESISSVVRVVVPVGIFGFVIYFFTSL